MQSIVVVGSPLQREEVVRAFIEDQKIQPYNIVRFDSKIGIEDSKEIGRFVSAFSASHDKKVVILANILTDEAQSALLKLIEELPETIFFFFLTEKKETLLPTILSRSKINSNYYPGAEDTTGTAEIDTIVQNFVEDYETLFAKLAFCEQIFSNQTSDAKEIFSNATSGLRKKLLKEDFHSKEVKDIERICFLRSLLFRMQENASLVYSNNLTPRFALEYCMLEYQR